MPRSDFTKFGWRGVGYRAFWGTCALFMGATLALGQGSPAPEAAYLLQLERLQNGHFACVLVHTDGQYHLELRLPEKTGFFEGTLPPDDLRGLVRILSDDKLLHLQQSDIHSIFSENGRDLLRLAIFRPGSARQDLTFPSPGFAFTGTVGPLLQWFERLEKRKGRKLSEDEGRNNCAIPGEKEIRVTDRPGAASKKPSRRPPPGLLLRRSSPASRVRESAPMHV